jgi:dCTP deaminase
MSQYIAVLSDRDIRREIEAGNIVFHDPERDCSNNIQNCSVDITLGKYYYRNHHPIPVFNPWCREHVEQYWGNVLEADTVSTESDAKKLGLNIGDRYIILTPGESILGHTREFIGGRNYITTMIKARSSMGRCNVTICRDAGWGDINFQNIWCLEITNCSTSPIVLPIDARIGQIIFFYTGLPDTVYSGKYQTGNTLEEMIKSWNPTMMLPKAYLDK